MRLLYHHRTSSRDGQAVHIDGLTTAWCRLGHELVMAAPATHARPKIGAASPLVDSLRRRLPLWACECLEIAYNVVAFARLVRLCRRSAPDVLYERYNLFLLAGVWLARLYRLPLLVEVNAPLFEERSRYGGLALRRLAAWSERTVWQAADVVLPVSAVLAECVRAAGVPEERIVVIPNGVGPALLARGANLTRERAELRRGLGLDGKLVLGFTGFLRSWHGLDELLSLLVRINPDSGELERHSHERHLLVIGDGPARPDLEQRVHALGLAGQVTFTGAVAPERNADLIATFDIALQPAVVPYASPLKLFEYMALCRAIVAPDSANIREILTDGETALLFDPATTGSLSRAVDRLCIDAPLRERLGAAARTALIRRGFTWDANARRVAALAGCFPRPDTISGGTGASHPLPDRGP
ncbi:MAG: glycosyltransferase family 4 protein [Rhodospirillaceae bacterium]